MIEPFVIAVAVFLIFFIIIKIRRKKLLGAIEPVQPINQESKPDDKVVSPVQATLQAKETSNIASESVPVQQVENPTPAPVKLENKLVVTPAYKNKNVPQDSMLRRHYLTHLRGIITELNQTTYPTDCMLRRHYDTHIASKIDQYLNDEESTQKLIRCYENYKKTMTSSVQEPQTIVSSLPETKAACKTVSVSNCKASKIPEDSMLRRHYLAQLATQIANNLPVPPTDSTLRRHYDTMLETEIKKQLSY